MANKLKFDSSINSLPTQNGEEKPTRTTTRTAQSRKRQPTCPYSLMGRGAAIDRSIEEQQNVEKRPKKNQEPKPKQTPEVNEIDDNLVQLGSDGDAFPPQARNGNNPLLVQGKTGCIRIAGDSSLRV